MTPDEMQKKFGPIILLAGLAIAASLYFSGDKEEPYRKEVEDAIKQKKALKIEEEKRKEP